MTLEVKLINSIKAETKTVQKGESHSEFPASCDMRYRKN